MREHVWLAVGRITDDARKLVNGTVYQLSTVPCIYMVRLNDVEYGFDGDGSSYHLVDTNVWLVVNRAGSVDEVVLSSYHDSEFELVDLPLELEV